MNSKAVRQYLSRYAEAEINLLADWPAKYCYKHVLVIPAYKESTTFLQTILNATWFQQDVLLILVVNQPDTAQDVAMQWTLHNFAQHCGQLLWQADQLSLIAADVNTNTSQATTITIGGHLLLVERIRTPIPFKQGVGLARKIGADLALALIAEGIIDSPWICSTDADAILPDNYFAALCQSHPDDVVACYPFEHIAMSGTDPAISAATLIYQQALRYYVAGLRYAGSPYACFSIGSILACKASAYAEVRGFPKRAAGEDFYLLNKLIKTGAVAHLTGATIRLQARLSDRVPFGTGVSTAKIMQLSREQHTFDYYHPQVFVALRETLQHFGGLWLARETPEDWLAELPPTRARILANLGIVAITATQSRQCRSKAQFDRQLSYWFDGLKTLQFIHQLRDSTYPNIPLSEAIAQAEFTVEADEKATDTVAGTG